MKKTYFQKFAGDKYNFYKPKQHTIAVESNALKKSRSRAIVDTCETNMLEQSKKSLKRETIGLSSREEPTV